MHSAFLSIHHMNHILSAASRLLQRIETQLLAQLKWKSNSDTDDVYDIFM
jgi:hypothetical protein